MIKKILLVLGCIGVIGLGTWLFFCHFNDHRQIEAGGYLVTFYSIPRDFQVGEMQIAVRLQDAQYRIVTEAEVLGYLRSEDSSISIPIKFEPGPGRDFRGWLTIEKYGQFVIDFQINHNQAQTIASFPISINK